MEENRNIYDQYDNIISVVDQLFYNEFDSVQLCKLQLNFLSFLSVTKKHLNVNFDDETSLQILRFEQQSQTAIPSLDWLEEIKNTVKVLSLRGKIKQ